MLPAVHRRIFVRIPSFPFSQNIVAGIYFVKNGKDAIRTKIRLYTAGSILTLENYKYARETARSEIGSHLTKTDLISFTFMFKTDPTLEGKNIYSGECYHFIRISNYFVCRLQLNLKF